MFLVKFEGMKGVLGRFKEKGIFFQKRSFLFQIKIFFQNETLLHQNGRFFQLFFQNGRFFKMQNLFNMGDFFTKWLTFGKKM